MSKLAIIRISGDVGLDQDIRDTFAMLHLNKKYSCVIVEQNDTTKGMLQKLKDYTTYGPVSEEVAKKLEQKAKGKKATALHPPIGGFERKGTKKPYKVGGVLGNRKDAINQLIEKMI